MPGPIAGLSLAALADAGGAETARRGLAGRGALSSWLRSAEQEQGGYLGSQMEGDVRQQGFTHEQNLLDEALARQKARLEQASQAAAMARDEKRYQEARAQAKFIALAEQNQKSAEEQQWYDRARFQTDENIRQQMALQALEPKPEDAPGTHARDFGGAELSSPRGAALLRDFGQQFKPSEYQMQEIITPAVEAYGDDPMTLMAQLRKPTNEGGMGSQSRRASVGLYNLGYMP